MTCCPIAKLKWCRAHPLAGECIPYSTWAEFTKWVMNTFCAKTMLSPDASAKTKRAENNGASAANSRPWPGRGFSKKIPVIWMSHVPVDPTTLKKPCRCRSSLGKAPYSLLESLFFSSASASACATSFVLTWSIHVSSPVPESDAVVTLTYLTSAL